MPPPGPVDLDSTDAIPVAATYKHTSFGRGKVTPSGSHIPDKDPAAGDDSQASANRRTSGTIEHVEDREGPPIRFVLEKGGRSMEHGNRDIRAAIAVEVTDRQPSREDLTIEPIAVGRCRLDERHTAGGPLEQRRTHCEGSSLAIPVEDVTIRLDEIESAVAVEVHRRDAKSEDIPSRPGQSERG
jgi:hypothetical protein